jgi:glutamate N-acetyltransferase/amino-acid N-acetyltransferase
MVDIQRSPLAPCKFPFVPQISGLNLTTAAADIWYPNRDDLLLAEFELGASVAGVFTRSGTVAAPVVWSREVTDNGYARALLVNSGNANAFTGAQGMYDVRVCATAVSDLCGCKQSEVLIASTGVIGERLPVERITRALGTEDRLGEVSTFQSASWQEAALAIATTDTYPKGSVAETQIDGTPIKIAGIAKGSGMIAPNMATMLAFVFTDAKIGSGILKSLLRAGVSRSFNCITVDSDTSTNDTLLLVANGQAGNRPPDSPRDKSLRLFRRSLDKVLTDLAIQVVRDGEGARKLMTIQVGGASSPSAAHKAAMAIANSPLVKTAIAGEDANWGRVIMAVGKSGVRLDQRKLSVMIGGVEIAKNGEKVLYYDDSMLIEHLQGPEIFIEVNLGIGRGKAKVWTCDLTHDYIRINAEYRT